MLVAFTGLSLIAPIGAQASDFNIEGMNTYVRKKSSSKTKKQFNSNTFANEVATFENVDSSDKFKEFEAGSFSDTTTMDGKVTFTVLSVDSEDNAAIASTDQNLYGNVHAAYTYQVNLNTSFNGDDNLYVRLKTGNHKGPSDEKTSYNTYLSAANGKADSLTVDKIWYTMPIGDTNNTVFIGPAVENYYMHGTTPSIYKSVLKSFTLGGNAAAYGASTSPGAGWKYVADNGFALSSNFATQDGENKGMLSKEGKTSWATQIGVTKPQYAVSAILNMKYNGWTDSYFKSTDGSTRPDSTGASTGDSTNYGLRGWWRPLETGTAVPEISVGYDTSKTEANTGGDTTDAYFVGLTWQDMFTAEDRIGLAFGQPQKHEDDTVNPFLYEIYYDYKLNDSVTVTPAFFGGTSKNSSGTEVDMTGYVVNTTLKF